MIALTEVCLGAFAALRSSPGYLNNLHPATEGHILLLRTMYTHRKIGLGVHEDLLTAIPKRFNHQPSTQVSNSCWSWTSYPPLSATLHP